MIPLSDENPTQRTPVVTIGLLVAMFATWIFVQGAGFNPQALVTTVCEYGLVPGEITHRAAIGTSIFMGRGMACVVDNQAINILTPFTSMFLHGGWGHILGNALFFWVFGNNVEDSMGRLRFLVFYLICGLAAAAAHTLVNPTSIVPTVGASGAISGILGAYLVLYPRVKVNMLFIFVIFFKVFRVPAWIVLLWWFAIQIIAGLPSLNAIGSDVSGGVAVWAHIGGFITGVVLVKLFVNPDLMRRPLTVPGAFDRPREGWPQS